MPGSKLDEVYAAIDRDARVEELLSFPTSVPGVR